VKVYTVLPIISSLPLGAMSESASAPSSSSDQLSATKKLLEAFKQDRKSEVKLEGVEDLSAQFQANLDRDMSIKDDLRLVARELERTVKGVTRILQRVHLEAKTDEKTTELGRKVETAVKDLIVPMLKKCSGKIPHNEYYRFSDFFKVHIVKSCYAVAFSKFLIDGSFATIKDVASALEIPTVDEAKTDTSFFLEWETYLEGLIDVAQELARLAKNCVILDNYLLIDKIHSYIQLLTYGFSGLNFRNDGLRRRFDSLKYDSRSIEEVVYDISLRANLNSK